MGTAGRITHKNVDWREIVAQSQVKTVDFTKLWTKLSGFWLIFWLIFWFLVNFLVSGFWFLFLVSG